MNSTVNNDLNGSFGPYTSANKHGINDSTVINDDSPEAKPKGGQAQRLPFNGQETLTIKNQHSNWSKDMSP